MCTIFLYDELNDCGGNPCNPAVPIDGYWTLEESPIGYPVLIFVEGVGTVNVINNETVIGNTFNPSVELGEFPTGLYIFRYHFGGACPQIADLAVNIVNTPCEADDIVVNICTGQGILNFFEMFEGECIPTEIGNFTAVNDLTGSGITLSVDDDGTNDSINTDISEDGTYIIEYEYFPENADTDCENCFRTVLITINVSETPTAGTEEEIVICN